MMGEVQKDDPESGVVGAEASSTFDEREPPEVQRLLNRRESFERQPTNRSLQREDFGRNVIALNDVATISNNEEQPMGLSETLEL
jgi:hypothetical protein